MLNTSIKVIAIQYTVDREWSQHFHLPSVVKAGNWQGPQNCNTLGPLFI
jgi:hypothetical protein